MARSNEVLYESLKEAPDARLVKSLSTLPGRAGTTTNIFAGSLFPLSNQRGRTMEHHANDIEGRIIRNTQKINSK